MNEQEPSRPYQSIFEADFAQKLEAIRKRYGSLAKFLKVQKSRSSLRETKESSLVKGKSVFTT